MGKFSDQRGNWVNGEWKEDKKGDIVRVDNTERVFGEQDHYYVVGGIMLTEPQCKIASKRFSNQPEDQLTERLLGGFKKP